MRFLTDTDINEKIEDFLSERISEICALNDGLSLNEYYKSSADVVYVSSLNLEVFLSYCRQGKDLSREKLEKSLFQKSRYEIELPLAEKKIDSILYIFVINETSKNIDCGHWGVFVYLTSKPFFYAYDSFPYIIKRKVERCVYYLKKYRLFNENITLCWPTFTPIQESCWECGYYVLILL